MYPARVFRADIGLLLSPQNSVVAAWQLPDPSTGGASIALSPQQLQARLHAAAMHAADRNFIQHLDTAKEAEGIVGQEAPYHSTTTKEAIRPPPASELDYALIDAGEPLLSGYPEEAATPQEENPQDALETGGMETTGTDGGERTKPNPVASRSRFQGSKPTAPEGDKLSDPESGPAATVS